MQPTTHAADAEDRFDPWGFGTTAADEPIAVIALTALPDDDLLGDDAGDGDALDAVVQRVAGPTDDPRSTFESRAPWRRLMTLPTLPTVAPAALSASLPAPVLMVAYTPAASLAPSASLAPAAPAAPAPQPSGRQFSRDMVGVLALFTLVILGQALYIGLSLTGEVRASAAPTGDLVLSSHPAGARVAIDGQDHGVTPLVVALPVGRHRVEVTGGDGLSPQALDADVAEGTRWTRHLALASAATIAADSGALRVDTPTPGAAVWLDGAPVGHTPLTHSGVRAGSHAVRVQFASGGIVERRVAMGGGETVSLVLDAPSATAARPKGPASGWVRVQTPFEVQVTEGGAVVGSSASERIMVTAGPHVFELRNAALGFRATVKVVVGAGRTEPLVVETPRTAVQVNAQPWAEVFVNGRLLGETPLANLQLPIGVHQLVFRHPEFGERAQSVTVRLDTPNRVTADLRRSLP